MRCKKHFADLSSSVGVCASCLRERLFSLIAAQAKASQTQAQSHHHHLLHVQAQSIDHHRKSDANNNNQPPLVFPRSVSPYISRRKSDNSAVWPPANHRHQQHKHSLSDQRFYSTPQIGPSGAYIVPDSGLNKKKHYRFSLITNIFRSRTHKRDSYSNSNFDSRFSVSNESATSAPSSSSSWFSGILPGRRRKQSRLFSLDEPATAPASGVLRIHPGYRDRGMSPARFSEDGEEDEHCESGYSSETSQAWKQTPIKGTKPVNRPNHARNVSGLAFCLSPLVRASPNRHWSQKGMPPETAFSGEIRVSIKPNISNAAAFCKNRSRKLADFGRSNPNH